MLAHAKRYVALLLLGVGLSVAPAYVHAYKISGASGIPTVLIGDTIIVNNGAYSVRFPYTTTRMFRAGTPKRGDLVRVQISNNPRLKGPFFKRVVGLPGEEVELREDRVFINGRALSVKRLNPADFAWAPKTHPIGSIVESEDGHWITYTPGKGPQRNHAAIRLASDQYFILGDNRDDSYDSREFGPVSVDCFLGKVIAVLPTGERVK